MTQDAKSLLALGAHVRRLGMSLAIDSNRLAMEARAAGRPPCPHAADRAADAFALERAARHLEADAQDHLVLALLPHRARFADLVRLCEAMDRGVDFVPVEAVAAERLPKPAAVVVVGQDDPSPSLRRRVTSGLARRLGRSA